MLNTGYECSARGSHVSRFYWHSLSLIIEIVALPSYLFCKRFLAPHHMCGGFAHMVLVLSTHGLVC